MFQVYKFPLERENEVIVREEEVGEGGYKMYVYIVNEENKR